MDYGNTSITRMSSLARRCREVRQQLGMTSCFHVTIRRTYEGYDVDMAQYKTRFFIYFAFFFLLLMYKIN